MWIGGQGGTSHVVGPKIVSKFVSMFVVPWPNIEGNVPPVLISDFGFGGTNTHVIVEPGRLPLNPMDMASIETAAPKNGKSEIADGLASVRAEVQVEIIDLEPFHHTTSRGGAAYSYTRTPGPL